MRLCRQVVRWWKEKQSWYELIPTKRKFEKEYLKLERKRENSCCSYLGENRQIWTRLMISWQESVGFRVVHTIYYIYFYSSVSFQTREFEMD